MDELSLRALLERATSPEPPLGHLVGNSLRAGRKLRQRRRATGAAALSAAAIVAVSAVPVLTSGAALKAGKPGPAALAMPPADARTAYVATGTDTVVPISLATNTAGTPIKVPVGMITGLVTFAAAAAPNGRVVYEVGTIRGRGAAVTPIDTATNTAGPAIALPDSRPGNASPTNIAVAPNGKTAYVAAEQDIFPINTTTNTADKFIRIRSRSWAMAFTPNGKRLYVLNPPDVVTPIKTANNTPLTPIKLPVPQRTPGYTFNIRITPNGKTAYVVYGVQEGKPYTNLVIPINLATNRALAPIPIEASGLASGLVIAPRGRTAYVLSSRAVTPIDTATNQAERAINLPASAGYAYYIALTPNGKTLYVLTPRGVIPIRTASRTVLPMIKVPKLENFTELAMTPDGRTIYVGAAITRPYRFHGHKFPKTVGGGIVPISTATNTAGGFINLGGTPVSITFAR